jgi:hypothetical protein
VSRFPFSVGDGRPTPKAAIIAPIGLVAIAIGIFFWMRNRRKNNPSAA